MISISVLKILNEKIFLILRVVGGWFSIFHGCYLQRDRRSNRIYISSSSFIEINQPLSFFLKKNRVNSLVHHVSNDSSIESSRDKFKKRSWDHMVVCVWLLLIHLENSASSVSHDTPTTRKPHHR